MSNENRNSTTSLPRVEYSAITGQYTPSGAPDSRALVSAPEESVRLVAVAARVTVNYDPGAHAIRRMIRKLNEE